jgi:hypothetical protein
MQQEFLASLRNAIAEAWDLFAALRINQAGRSGEARVKRLQSGIGFTP